MRVCVNLNVLMINDKTQSYISLMAVLNVTDFAFVSMYIINEYTLM